MSARKHCNSMKKDFFLEIRCLEQFFHCSSKFDALCCWIICHKETVSARASICRNSRPNSSSLLLCLTLLFLQTPFSAPMSFPDLKLHNQIDFLWQWNDVYFIFMEIFKIKFYLICEECILIIDAYMLYTTILDSNKTRTSG